MEYTPKTKRKNPIKKDCENLAFLAEFMTYANMTPPDLAKKMGVTRQSVATWFRIDDMSINRATEVLNTCGYSLRFYYTAQKEPKQITTITLRKEDMAEDADKKKNMYFLLEAMAKYNFTKKDIAEKLGISYNSVLVWFTKSYDISISYIGKIAEAFDLKVNVEIKPLQP